MFEWIYILYVIVCGVLIGLLSRGDRREWAMRMALAIGLPVVGFLLPAFWPQRNRSAEELEKNQRIFDHFDLSGAANIKPLSKPDTEEEMNLVPLEEALLINDYPTRRRVMIDLLKQDSLEYLEVLQMAVSNDDTETSHYAVSAIMEIKRKLTLQLQQFAVQYEENKDDPFLLQAYADVLRSYMQSGFLDERTLTKHRYTYSGLLGRLLELIPDHENNYCEKIDTDLLLGEYVLAEHTAVAYLRQCPHSEDAYLKLMKVYFTTRSIDKLKETLEDLKNSPLRLSNQALMSVRFWTEGA
ncbi:hypothetical protein [Paenibacillus sp. GCM10027626]|uniref:hypothetical protein n=1 Tax=Paenibacillus sp. GCM10027626 TaxID=3273411 RepID=UPI00362806A3